MGTQAYSPGLTVSARMKLRRRRILPIPGTLQVAVGDRVASRDVIAQAELPGRITPFNVANLLSIPPSEVIRAMLLEKGQAVSEGTLLARSRGILGWFRREYRATVSGTIEAISAVTGQLMIRGAPRPVQLRAFLAGSIAEIIPQEGAVIEAEGALIQGIFGIGGETFGSLVPVCQQAEQSLDADRIVAVHRGSVVVGGGRVTVDALRKAVEVGVSAIVTGGIDDQDLRDFLGYDLGVATTGSETVGLTLIITEGFGDIGMAARTFDLLNSHAGADVAVNGATQIRAGVLRPEIIIPTPPERSPAAAGAVPAGEFREPHVLRVGLSVRIIRDPYFGMIGPVIALPAEPRVLDSGSKARVLEVQLPGGEQVIVPRANVELIEE
jgi:hypothetical protein